MNIEKIINVIGQLQTLLAVLGQLPTHVHREVTGTLKSNGIDPALLTRHAVRTKHSLQAMPGGTFAPMLCISASHLHIGTLNLLLEGSPPASWGLEARLTPWGALINIAAASAYDATMPADVHDMKAWAADVGVSWVLMHAEHPVVSALQQYEVIAIAQHSPPKSRLSELAVAHPQSPARARRPCRVGARLWHSFGDSFMYEISKAGAVHSQHNTLADVLWHLNDRHAAAPLKSTWDQVQVSMTVDGQQVTALLRQDCNHIAPVLDGIVEPKELVILLLDEVMPYLKTDQGQIKAPYEMMRSQWGAFTTIGDVAYGVIPCFGRGTLSRVPDLVHFAVSEICRRLGYGHNGPPYDRSGQINDRHVVHVAHGLARGREVPQEVLAEYLANQELRATEMYWFGRLLRQPFLRGRFRSVDEMSTVFGILGKEFELTEEALPSLLAALHALPEGADYVQIDNQLYKHGFVSLRPQHPLPDPATLGAPVNEFAEDLRAELIRFRTKRDAKLLAAEVAKGKLTVRDIDERQRAIDAIAGRERYDWANKVAGALQEKNLPLMLQVLCDANNEASQRAVERHCGVKLRNTKAADRRRTVFALAGHVSDGAYHKAEQDLQAERDRRKAQAELANEPERLARLKDTAAMRRVRFEGEILTCDVFVERLVEQGFNQVVQRPRGAARTYYLHRDGDSSMYGLKSGDGTLAYAQALVSRLPAGSSASGAAEQVA